MGCFLFLPGRARGPTARRPTPTHTIYYSALVGGGRRPFGPHLAAAEVSHTLSAEQLARACFAYVFGWPRVRPSMLCIRFWLAPGPPQHALHTFFGWSQARPGMLCIRFWLAPGPPQHVLHTFLACPGPAPACFAYVFWLVPGPGPVLRKKWSAAENAMHLSP